MKSERVTQAWEFYRDNCQGYKEPMRREFRKLDEHVSSVEAENAKLREACERLIQTVRVAESISDCGLLDKRFEGELRDIGFEVD